jgi:asparagine synthase (glutamine-hydrolysing)
MGFGIPVNQWLRGELRSWSTDLLSNNNAELYDILRKEKISDEFDGFYAHKHDNGHQIWTLSMLFAWHANFIASTKQPIQPKQEAIVV